MASTAYAAKAAVRDIIAALPEATAGDWQIVWSFDREFGRTAVWISDVNWDSSVWVTNRSREEVYRLSVICNVKRQKTTPPDAERMAYEMGAAIEDAIKASPDLGLGTRLIVATDCVPKRLASWPADNFTEAQYEFDISITGRL